MTDVAAALRERPRAEDVVACFAAAIAERTRLAVLDHIASPGALILLIRRG